MPIDPSIPLQVQPLKLESPANQLAMMGDAMKIGEMQRGVETQNKLRELYSQGVDVSTPEGFKQIAGIDPAVALKLKTQAIEGRKLEAETGIKEFELKNNKINTAITRLANLHSPQEAVLSIQQQVQNGDLPAERAQQLLRELQTMPFEQFKTNQLTSILSAKDNLTLQTTRRGQDISAATARRGQDLANNPELQGRIETAKVLGKARGEEIAAPTKDVQANVKALKSAGYDVETGKDSISDLIQKSTGSFAGAGTDLALRGVGISTGGAKAIAALKTYESKLTQDLLGGKMGAGISNADRDFIVAGIGQIADSTLPVETRQAAWNAVKERMRVAGMVPAPKGENATAPTTTPSGASVSNW